MRISRFQLASLAAILAGASPATADDRNVTEDIEDPVFTATAQNATPGDVTVSSGGTIEVSANEAAITINSNNDVTNSSGGSIGSVEADNSQGIRILSGFAGTVVNGGNITLIDDYTLVDTDGDGDFDGEYAEGAGRTGILLDAGTFTGNITSSGPIRIEGNDSSAIRLNGLLDGDGLVGGTGHLTVSGQITMVGDNSSAIRIDGGVSGDAYLRSSVVAQGEGTFGALINSDIGGELRINGTWVATGFHATTPGTSTLEPLDDLLLGGSTIYIGGSVGEGVTIEGIGVADDEDDDGDGVTETTGDANDDFTATVRSFGSAPTIMIDATTTNIVLGPTIGLNAPAGDYGFHNQGTISAEGVYEDIEATAVRLQGVLAGSSVNTTDGIVNDGTISTTAREADAYGISIGPNVLVPGLINNRAIGVGSITENTDTSYAIFVDLNGTLNTVTNTGTIRSTIFGEEGTAYAIADESGTLTSVSNTNQIIAAITVTDDDTRDDIIPVANGVTVAIDVSNSMNAVISQTENADDDIEELIQGDIRFGGGADQLNLSAGQVLGNVSFGVGADTLLINGGALYRGIIDDSDDNIDITVNDGTLHLEGGAVVADVVVFGAAADFRVLLSDDPADPPVITANSVTFLPGSTVTPIVPAGLPDTDTIVFLDAASLTGGGNVLCNPASCESASFLYDLTVELTNPMAADGAANGLQAVYERKSAAALGLSANESAAFDPILDALSADPDAAAAFAAIDNALDFNDSYEDLLPNFSSAATEVAATAIQQLQSATSNRLSATRLNALDEVSVWTQEIGYGLSREPATTNGQEFRGQGFGLAMGIDGPLDNGALFGVSASFLASEVEEPGRPEGEISASFGQFNAYFGTAAGPIDLDFVGGVGVGRMQSRRFVEIGETFSALSEGEWWSYEGHGLARASAPMRMANWFVVTPQVALTYVVMNEQGYTEEGGGAAIDYEVDSATSQRLWGDAGVEFSARFSGRSRSTIIAPRLFLGYRANVLDDETDRTFRFASGTDTFTLTDETVGEGGPLIGLGIDTTNGYSTFSLSYEGEFGDQIERHSLNAAVRFRF